MSGDFTGSGAAGPAAGSRIAGYRLDEQIGAGGMAVVFRAHDDRLGRPVALKVLAPALASDEAFRQRFIRESRVAAAVDDPHIIPVHEAGEADGVLFIAMRYVPGGDVRSLLRREGPLSPARALAIASPVASALDAAHEAGLVHRDVKPANMLLDTRPGRPDHVYLSDFGLCRPALSATGLTSTGQYLGTLSYSAPEQLAGQAVDGRTDQYSLACALFELLTGTPPFPREPVTAMIMAHMSEPPPRLTQRRPDLPASADAVLARALAKLPPDRFRTCREFTDNLRDALGLPPYDFGHWPGQPAGQAVSQPVNQAPTTVAAPPWPRSAPPWQPSEPPPRVPTPTLIVARPEDVVSVPPGPPGHISGTDGRDTILAGAHRPEPGQAGGTVPTLAFSPDGMVLAAGDGKGGIRLWDARAERQLATLGDAGSSVVESVAFSPDGNLLASGDDAGDVILWDYRNQRVFATLPARGAGSVFAVAFSRDGATVAGGDDNGNVVLWDLRNRRKTTTLGARRGSAIFAVAFGPDGSTLAAGDDSGDVTVWDYRSRGRLATLPAQGKGSVFAVAFSPNGAILAAGDDIGGTRLWNNATATLAATLPGPESGGIYGLAFSPVRPVLAAGDDTGFTCLWDLLTRSRSAVLTGPGARSVTAVAFSPDGATLAAGDDNGIVYLWKWTGATPAYAAVPHRSSTLPN